MSDKQDNSSDRVEGLLRQWGAEEAAREARAPRPPAARPARVGTAWRAAARWAPLAAAAMLLAAAGALYLPRFSSREPSLHAGRIQELPPLPPASQPDANAIEHLRTELAELRKSLGESEARLKELADLPRRYLELQGQLDIERKQHAADVAEFLAGQKPREKEKEELAAANKGLAEKLSAAEQRLAALEKEKAELAPAAAEAPQLKADVKSLQQRLAAAVNEMDQLRRQREEAEAASADARRQMQALEARHSEVVAAFQRTYLASLAPGESGLAARKTAARVRRMVERCAQLSSDVRGQSARTLLARLEAVLTRLDLLNPMRIGSEDAFAKLLGRGELAKEIDEILAAGTEPESVRTWLFEVKLILMGAEHAG